MTVRELIEILNNLPEDEKDMPVISRDGYGDPDEAAEVFKFRDKGWMVQ